MNFALHNTEIYRAVRITRILPHSLLRIWRLIFSIVGSVAVVLYAIQEFSPIALSGELLPLEAQQLLGVAFITLPLSATIGFFEIYLAFFMRRPPLRDTDNIAEYLDFTATRALSRAERIAHERGESAISPTALLLALAKEKRGEFVLVRLDINPNDLRETLSKSQPEGVSNAKSLSSDIPASDGLLDVLAGAFSAMRQHKAKRISLMDLFVGLADIEKTFQQTLVDRNLDQDDLHNLAIWFEADGRRRNKRNYFWTLENLIRKPPVGAGWSYGYTPLLNHFGENLTRRFKEGRDEIELIGRDVVMEHIEEILARAGENNVLLVGETGVGKNTIIQAFAQLVALGEALPSLHYKQVFRLNASLLTSASENPTETRQIIINVLNEAAKAGSVILIIEDLHAIVSSQGEVSGAELMEIFVPYISSTAIQVIATTDPLSFHRVIAQRQKLLDVFETVEVNEPSLEETMQIVHQVVPELEARSKVLLTYPAIKTAVEGADKYIQTIPFPEKAIHLLAEVVSSAEAHGRHLVEADDVNAIITRKTDIPAGTLGEEEKEKLINLEEVMHRDIVGQEEAVTAVAQTLRRLRAGLTSDERPAGAFLFVGPTGVGKTLTAKVLAKHYFGSEDHITRFDMSEYQNPDSVRRFLGSVDLDQPGQLITAMRDNPSTVVLLDEFEKANHDILNLFLQVFDEGYITDVFGRKVNFEQSIIIATSNAAADKVVGMIKKGIDPSKKKEQLMNLLINAGNLVPELLNRFDEVVVFHPLSRNDIHRIAEMLLEDLVERLDEQGYRFTPTEELVDYVTEIGYNPQFGARPMRRAIQDTVESLIAQKILKEEIQKNKPFSISLQEISNNNTPS